MPSPNIPHPLSVSIREAARLLGVSPVHVRRLIRRGVLKAARLGGRVVVPWAELERALGVVEPDA
jgi:excisionase family DNA binding protein